MLGVSKPCSLIDLKCDIWITGIDIVNALSNFKDYAAVCDKL